MPKFTHLVPTEAALANAFISQNPIGATDWIFDLHLGEGMPLDPSWPPYIRYMATRLTQRRVDILGITPSSDWIIELKERGSIHAIGQLVVYQSLYTLQFPDKPTPQLALVSPYLGFDLGASLQQFNITYFQIPPTPYT
jgi:hypothetical protein